MTKNDPLIQVSHLTLRFGEKTPFRNFSLAVSQGERVVLTGESGTGKSTFLKCLLGFAIPDEGEITVDGIPLNDTTVWKLRTRFAYVPQEPELGDGTVREWLERPFTYRANSHLKENLSRLPELMQKLSLLPSLLDAKVETLSGGEKQRVALIGALLLDREILLLDEPTSALDKKNSRAIISLLVSLDMGAIIGVSHDPDLLSFADRVIPFPENGGS